MKCTVHSPACYAPNGTYQAGGRPFQKGSGTTPNQTHFSRDALLDLSHMLADPERFGARMRDHLRLCFDFVHRPRGTADRALISLSILHDLSSLFGVDLANQDSISRALCIKSIVEEADYANSSEDLYRVYRRALTKFARVATGNGEL